MANRRSLFAGVAVLVCLTAASAHAAGPVLDFSRLDGAEPIGSGKVNPRPEANQVLLLQFWASWCHSCASLMWDMDDIASRDERVKYVAVSLDDEPSDAAAYIQKHQLFEKYADRYFIDTTKSLSASLGIETVPTVLLVSADGRVLLTKSGHLNSTDLNDIMTALREHPGHGDRE